MALCLTGLLTSVHCMAMCGGLNLSQSMKCGEQSSWRNSVLYNMRRVCSYTLTGALLGALGSVVSISVEVRRYRIICWNLYAADGVEYAGSAAVFA